MYCQEYVTVARNLLSGIVKTMENFTWFGHASFSFIDRKTGQKIYYIDPFHLPHDKDLVKADIIFVTHAHPDHLSPPDISILLKDDTVVIATQDSLETLQISQEKFPVSPNNEYSVKGFNFKTVPAYNTNPDRPHKKEYNWVGYIFEINGMNIYHAGDTDYIPEMDSFDGLNLDIAFLPMGGTYTMDVDEMISAANVIKAKTTIPMHYKGMLREKAGEAEEKLKKGVINSEVVILKEFQ